MRTMAVSLIVAAVLASYAAMAEDSSKGAPTAPTVPAAAAPSPTNDSDTIVCKTELVTGSHFTQKVCANRSQWQAMHDTSVNSLNENSDQARQRAPRP